MRGWGLMLVGLLLSWPQAADAGRKKDRRGDEEAAQVDVQEVTPAVADAPTVDIPCRFEPGTEHRYQNVDTTTTTAADGSTSVRSSSTPMTYTVQAHDEVSSAVTLTYGVSEIQAAPDNAAMAAVGAYMATRGTELGVQLAVDHEGGAIGVSNIDEVVAFWLSEVPAMGAQMKAADPDLPQQALDGMAAMLGNAALMEQQTLKSIGPTFDYSCVALPLTPVTYTASLPNPLGGPPFPAKGTITTLPAVDGIVEVTLVEQLDPVAAEDIVRQLAQAAGVPFEADTMPAMQLDVESTVVVHLDTTLGWPVDWRYERRIGAQGQVRVELTQATRLE